MSAATAMRERQEQRAQREYGWSALPAGWLPRGVQHGCVELQWLPYPGSPVSFYVTCVRSACGSEPARLQAYCVAPRGAEHYATCIAGPGPVTPAELVCLATRELARRMQRGEC